MKRKRTLQEIIFVTFLLAAIVILFLLVYCTKQQAYGRAE